MRPILSQLACLVVISGVSLAVPTLVCCPVRRAAGVIVETGNLKAADSFMAKALTWSESACPFSIAVSRLDLCVVVVPSLTRA